MADAGNGSSVATARLGGSAVVALVYGAPVSRAGVMVEGEYRITVDDIGREMSRPPKGDCCGPSVVESVPGHKGVLPVGSGRCGGALG